MGKLVKYKRRHHARRNPSTINSLLKSDLFTIAVVGAGGYYVWRRWGDDIKKTLFPPKTGS